MTLQEEICVYSDSFNWYDRTESLARSIVLLEKLSQPVLGVFCEAFQQMSLVERQINIQRLEVKSVGSDKLLGLYNSNRKRRYYDKNPALCRIIKHYALLSEKSQDFMVAQISQSVVLLEQYLRQFTTVKEGATPEHIADLSREHLLIPNHQTEAFLEDLRAFLIQSVSQPGKVIRPRLAASKVFDLAPVDPEEEPALATKTRSDTAGMKVTMDWDED